MKLFEKRPLALVLLGFILSSLISALLNIHTSGAWRLFALAPLFFVLITFLILRILHRPPRRLLCLSVLVLLLLGPLCQHLYHRALTADFERLDAGKLHTVQATVYSTESSRRKGAVYTVKTETVNGERSRMTLRLYVDESEIPLMVGDTVLCEVSVTERIDPYLYRQEISGSITADSTPILLSRDGNAKEPFFKRWQARLSARILRATDGAEGALIVAVLLGDRNALPTSISTDFRRTGLSHVLALSGLHLSVLAVFLLRLLRRLGLPRYLTFTAFLLFLALYAAIAGFPLSLLRAAGMLLISEVGRLVRLRADPVTSLFVSITVIMLISPSAATDLGLWLSFLATLGILTTEGDGVKERGSPLRTMLRGLRQVLVATCMALCFTSLLTALTFGGASLVAIPANLLVTPLIHALLLLGPSLLLFPSLLGGVAAWTARVTLSAVALISDLRSIYLPTSTAFLISLFILSGTVLILLISIKRQKIYHITSLAALLLSFAVLISGHVIVSQQDSIHYISQYDSEYILVRADRKTVLIVNNGSVSALSRLETILRSESIGDIDTLILLSGEDQADELLVRLTGQARIHRLLTLPQHGEGDALPVAPISDLRLDTGVLASRGMLDGGISYRFLGGIMLQNEERRGFLLKLEINGRSIAISSGATLVQIGNASREIFLRNADIAIALGGLHSAHNLSGVRFPDAAAVILTQTKGIPDSMAHDPRVLISPTLVELPLK